MIPKAESGAALSDMMKRYAPSDIAVEEEDIGAVVERIYAGGGTL
jgi:hypothetical protein